MNIPSAPSARSFRSAGRAAAAALLLGTVALTGCKSTGVETPASMAVRHGTVGNVNDVKVRVSLSNRAVYVYENDEPRFVAAVGIGMPSHPTPTGSFRIQSKEARKRSSIYGFFRMGDRVVPGKSSNKPAGATYIGYPLPYWAYFAHDCGFHAGTVRPQPHTHGCLRLHKSVAEDFFNMIKVGTPVTIADSLPEDATLGKNVPRPTDYDMPDSPPAVKASDKVFTDIESVWF